jgi:hypothetical protein
MIVLKTSKVLIFGTSYFRMGTRTHSSTKYAGHLFPKVTGSGTFEQDLTRVGVCHVDQSGDDKCQFCHVACRLGFTSMTSNHRLTRVIFATWQPGALPKELPRMLWVGTTLNVLVLLSFFFKTCSNHWCTWYKRGRHLIGPQGTTSNKHTKLIMVNYCAYLNYCVCKFEP